MDGKDIEALFEKTGKKRIDLAKRFGVQPQQITALTQGTRLLKAHELPIVRDFFGLDESVPLKGYVGGGGLVARHTIDEDQLARVSGPRDASEATAALEIRGDSLGAEVDGWVLFFQDEKQRPTKALNGLCVVGLSDGRVLLRRIQPSRLQKRYHLTLGGQAPILDTPIEWASPVVAMEPRRK